MARARSRRRTGRPAALVDDLQRYDHLALRGGEAQELTRWCGIGSRDAFAVNPVGEIEHAGVSEESGQRGIKIWRQVRRLAVDLLWIDAASGQELQVVLHAPVERDWMLVIENIAVGRIEEMRQVINAGRETALAAALREILVIARVQHQIGCADGRHEQRHEHHGCEPVKERGVVAGAQQIRQPVSAKRRERSDDELRQRQHDQQ
ncbi:MAG: hypothetical protein ACTHNK_14400, partial [Thermomicrobiales bacterium]